MSEQRVQKCTALEMQFFGSFSMRVHGTVPHLRARAEQYILALLALKRAEPVERGWIAGALWPESSDEQAHFNLRRNLTDLRKALGSESIRLVSLTSRTLQFDFSGASCDLIIFDDAIRANSRASLELAVSLYGGQLLSTCDAAWILPDRSTRHEGCLTALERLAVYANKSDDFASAAGYLRTALVLDPSRESALCGLMEALARKGDYAGALHSYRQFRIYLHNELNLEPHADATALYERLLDGPSRHNGATPEVHNRAVEEKTDRRPGAERRVRRRLPSPITTLIGREEERRDVAACLRNSRLVTLTGSGGVGKTRLAIAIASDTADLYMDGACFVPLANVVEAPLVPKAVASALNLHEEDGRPVAETIRAFLECKSLLLVLDNCEHLLTCCSALAEMLLESCPALRVLATSRISLGIVGETIRRVPSLSLPNPSTRGNRATNPLVYDQLESSAVRLFVERARAADAGFAITDRNIVAVGDICRLLDGIPFAIELSAALVKAFTAETISLRLKQRLLPLANSSRTAPPRQQTLRAMLDWSFALLDEREAQLLRRLAVFAGEWTLEAAEAVCNTGELPEPDITGVLSGLVDKSLVMCVGRDGVISYRLLETTREYAGELWDPSYEQEMHRYHARYYRQLASEAVRELSARTGTSAVHSLKTQEANALAARRWLLASDVEAEQEFTLDLLMCGAISYHSQEIRDWIARLDTSESQSESPLATAIYLYLGRCAEWLGDLASGCRLWEKALCSSTKTNYLAGVAQSHRFLAFAATKRQDFCKAHEHYETAISCLHSPGNEWPASEVRNEHARLMLDQGSFAAAREKLEQSLDIGRCLDDWRIVVDTLDSLGRWAYTVEDFSGALSYWQERIQTLREHSWLFEVPRTLSNIATVHGHLGAYKVAWANLEEALAMSRRATADPTEAWIHFSMARLALKQGCYANADGCLYRTIAIFSELNEQGSLCFCLRAVMESDVAQHRFERAVCLLANAFALIRRDDLPILASERAKLDNLQTELQAAVSPDDFQNAWNKGEVMSLDRAVEFALEAIQYVQ